MAIKTKAQLATEANANINTNGTNAITGALHNTMLNNTFDSVVSIIDAETINGVKTFGQFPVTPSAAPTTNYQAANKKYVDDSITTPSLWEIDGTETQLITPDAIDMQSEKIINLLDPTANQDAATKKYVDDTIAGTGPKIFSATATATVTNTVTSTTLIASGVGSTTLGSNTLAVGDVVRIRQYGLVTNGTGGDVNLTLKVILGGTTLGSATGSTLTGASNWEYQLDAAFTVRSIGAGGTIMFSGFGLFELRSTTNSWAVIPLSATSATSVDTTADKTIDIQAQWASASLSLSISALNTVIEKLT